MKKIAIFLAVVMLIASIPAVYVAAEDAYYLKGIHEGEYILANIEKSRTLTLVNSAEKNKLPSNATGVEKVVFTYNDEEAVTDSEAPFEYNLAFSSCGEQSLTYDVYTTGSAEPLSKTISFSTIAAVESEESYREDFETLTDVTKFYHGLSSSGANASISDGKFLFERVQQTSGMKQFAFKCVPINSADAKVQYHEFEVSWNADCFECTLRSDWAQGSSDIILDTSGSGKDKLEANKTYKIGMLLDFNSMVAVVRIDGVELKRVPLTNFKASGSNNPFLHIRSFAPQIVTLDNYKLLVYDKKTPQEFSESSIPGGENNPVAKNIEEIRITGNDFLENQELSGFVSIEPEADISLSTDENELVVTFNDNLLEGTTYTLTVDGVKDKDFLSYKPYSLTFRTLNPGENIPPVVQLLSPVGGERYYPGDSITFSAEASDSNGSISYVEFYKNGELIENSRVESPIDGVYTCEWSTGEEDDSPDVTKITALACDDEGAKVSSTPVSIKIQSMSHPSVLITAPENDQVYFSNFGGYKTDVKPKITFEAEDIDGEIENIEIFVDGESVFSTTDNTVKEYTVEDALDVGTHIISVDVTDDDGQLTFAQVSLNIETRGKSGYILCDDLQKNNLLSKWDKTGNAVFNNGTLKENDEIKGIIISTDSSGESTLSRTCVNNLESMSFGVDVKLAFSDTQTLRKIMLDTKEIITFTADGKITYSGSEKGTYFAGEIYDISAVIDAETLKMYIFLNGKYIGSAGISSTDFTTLESFKIIHSGNSDKYSETAVLYLSISRMSDETAVPTVKLFDSSSNTISTDNAIDIDNISYITVDFEEGVDSDTLKGNLKLINTKNGKQVRLSYSNGKFNIGERLKYDCQYSLVLLPDARDVNGNGYCGAYEIVFNTAEPSENVGVDNIAVSNETINGDTYSANLTISFNGTGEAGKKVTVVYAAYNEAEMTDFNKAEIEVGTALETATIPIELDGVTQNTVIEAFVVENMENIKTVSDTIFKIK